jgi:hypothetical protein
MFLEIYINLNLNPIKFLKLESPTEKPSHFFDLYMTVLSGVFTGATSTGCVSRPTGPVSTAATA